MSLQALREQRGAIATALQELVGKSDWDATTDQAAYDKGLAELDVIDAKIERINAVNERIADDALTASVADAADRRGHNSDDRGLKLYAKWLKGGDRALSEDDFAYIRNTMSTTTGSEGGFTVATEVAKTVVDALKAFGGMREVADVIATAGGNPLNYPTSDGTAEEGEIVAENVAATDLDVSFGTVGLGVYKFSSKVVTVPFELLQDSSIDVESFVNRRIVTRLGRITNRMFTVGTGTGQPTGADVAAAVGITAANGTSQVTAIVYESLVDLQHSIDPSYREMGNCRFMMNDASLKVVRKIKDSTGRPIFVPGYEVSVPGGAPDTLLGSPIKVNQHMPVMAAGARSILFGDFKGYVIRDAMDISMFRFNDSAYTKKGQVGFMAWMRAGGNLTDISSVKAFVNAAT